MSKRDLSDLGNIVTGDLDPYDLDTMPSDDEDAKDGRFCTRVRPGVVIRIGEDIVIEFDRPKISGGGMNAHIKARKLPISVSRG